MRSPAGTLLAVIGAASVLGGCEADRRFGPDVGDVLLATGGRSTTAAPSNLVATSSSWSTIDLVWQDNSSNEDGFEVHRSTTGAAGTYSPYTTAGAGATSMTDFGVSASTEFCYKVRAFITRGRKNTYSGFSNASCATTAALPVPDAPGNTTAIPSGSSSVGISWTAGSDPEYGFRVERSVNTAAGPWETLASVAPSSRTAGDWSRTPDQVVCYRVIASNRYGSSAPSIVDCTAPPSAPTNLAATATGTTTIDLSWQDNSAVEDGYEVRMYGPDYVTQVVATLPADAQAHQVAGLTPDTRYTFWVVARKDGGSSDASNHLNTATASTGPPAAPTSLWVSPNGSTAIYLQWSAPSPSTVSHRVERSADNLSWVEIAAPSEYWYTDQGVTTEQLYYYRVIAVNARGEASDPSAVGSTAAPAAPTNLTTEPSDPDQQIVRWTDNSFVEDGYEVWFYYYDWYCDDWGCYLAPYYYAYWVDANTTSFIASNWEYLHGVAAVNDGGYSDFAYYAPSTAAPAPSVSERRSIPQGAMRRERPRAAPAPRR